MRTLIVMGFAVLMATGGALAQVAAPAAQVAAPAAESGPTGKTPPGAPSGATQAGRMERDSTGQKVIGHTVNAPSAVAGDPGKQETGTK